ncbi:S-layer homology domain-containing protein [Solibacillus isronensis]|uniref:S-layer homology domain-containing protein n=1 Tax=Solibacillus isronensis TaxID=412383 RepID=UPI0009A7CB81|nr:S-layer homology domain-containing protein [Solibacillus isronensis]
MKKTTKYMALFTIPAIIITAPADIDAANDWQVENTENLIDQINPFSSTYEYYLNEARNAYYLLSDYQQNQVRNSTTLLYYLGSNNDHQYVLTTFTNKMAAITARNSSFLRDIEEANRYYHSLTTSQQAVIPNYLYLQLQNYMENMAKMKAVQLKLEQLSLQDSNYVYNYETTMQAYQLLPYDFRMLITPLMNEKKLEYETYYSPTNNRSIAQQVINEISKLSTSSTMEQVASVRVKYNGLTTLQQNFVSNYHDLLYIEEVLRNTSYGWDPYYEDEKGKPSEYPTNIEVTNKGQMYTVVMPVSKMNRYTNTKITVSDTITLSIPNKAVRKTNNDDVLTMTIEEMNEESILFTANMYDESFEFSSYIDIEVKGLPSSATIVRLHDGGEYIATPYRKIANKFIIKTKTSAQFTATNSRVQFFDIHTDGHRYEIEQLAKRKIVSGVENGLYKPNAKVTLAQYAAMIARSMNITSSESSTYQDVHGKWYESSIESLLEAGILEQPNSNYFNAEKVVTRKEAAVLSIRLLQYAGINISDPVLNKIPFTDFKQLSTADSYFVAAAYELGIFGGKENGQFDPNGKLTRSQMAKVLYKTLQIAKMI